MAEFLPAFERMIVNEGGYVLHTVAGDRGGMTYAGIARNFHPGWPGWRVIDQGETPPAELVRQFYRSNFWAPLRRRFRPGTTTGTRSPLRTSWMA